MIENISLENYTFKFICDKIMRFKICVLFIRY